MNSNKNWGLLIDPLVYRQLDKFLSKDARKIIAVLSGSSFDPYQGDIKKIKEENNIWRRRVGNYRIFYEISQAERKVHVFWVERRSSKTYK